MESHLWGKLGVPKKGFRPLAGLSTRPCLTAPHPQGTPLRTPGHEGVLCIRVVGGSLAVHVLTDCLRLPCHTVLELTQPLISCIVRLLYNGEPGGVHVIVAMPATYTPKLQSV